MEWYQLLIFRASPNKNKPPDSHWQELYLGVLTHTDGRCTWLYLGKPPAVEQRAVVLKGRLHGGDHSCSPRLQESGMSGISVSPGSLLPGFLESWASSEPWIVTDSYRYKLYLPLGSNSQESKKQGNGFFSHSFLYFFQEIQFPSLPAYLGS